MTVPQNSKVMSAFPDKSSIRAVLEVNISSSSLERWPQQTVQLTSLSWTGAWCKSWYLQFLDFIRLHRILRAYVCVRVVFYWIRVNSEREPFQRHSPELQWLAVSQSLLLSKCNQPDQKIHTTCKLTFWLVIPFQTQ
jgi:hypothetical protein